jgi:hypothetical protein
MKYFPNEADLNETEQHVTTFRQLLARVSGFRDALAGRNDHAGAADDALVLLGEWRDLLRTIGLADLGGLVCGAEALDGGGGPEAAATLVAMSRLLLAFGPGFMPAAASAALAADLGLMSVGDPHLIAAGIPRAGRASRPGLLQFLKAQAIRFAHYRAGLTGTSWKAEFRRLRPGLGETTLKEWSRSISPAEREDYRRVGDLVRRESTLAAEDEAIKAQATRYDETALGKGLADLL